MRFNGSYEIKGLKIHEPEEQTVNWDTEIYEVVTLDLEKGAMTLRKKEFKR